jgi:hypothetical protein
MGTIHGDMRRYPAVIRNERSICTPKRDNRKTVWYSERESWFSIYADVWKSPDGNEGRVDFCMHEFEEVSKNQSKKGITEYGKSVENFYFGCNSICERKMAPGHVPRSCFVYTLGRRH